MLKTPVVSIAMVLLASVLGAVGQFLFKSASDHARAGVLSILTNTRALAGMACYVIVMIIFTGTFRKGGGVTVLYPLYATTFIWAAIIALLLYGVPIRPVHVVGMVLLVVGILLMALERTVIEPPVPFRETPT